MGVMKALSLLPRSMGGRGAGGSGGGVSLYYKFKMQLDMPKVHDVAQQWTGGALSRIGAFVMRAARSSIRRRKKVSDPGKPPSAHNDQLKRGIFFGIDEARGSVVIGPVLLSGVSSRGQQDIPATRLLEEGGEVNVYTTSRRGGYHRTGFYRKMRYRARPYMKPAFDKGIRDFQTKEMSRSGVFADSVTFTAAG